MQRTQHTEAIEERVDFFFTAREWVGEPQSLEGQAFSWQGSVDVEPLLPATIPLIEWLDRLRGKAGAL